MSFRTATFGEICEFKYGKSLAASSRIPGDAVVYGSNGPVGTHITPLSDGPTIVIGRKGSVGEVHYCGGPNWAIDTTYFIDATSTDCNLKWLSYALSASRIRQLNKAAAIPGLNRNDAYRESVLVPSLDEQKRIAAILDKADQLRQKRRQAIALLDSLTQSIFLEMFGDPVVNPKHLKKKSLGELIKVSSGNGLTSAQMDSSGVYSVYGGNGINGSHSSYMFEEPQIAIGRVGVYCGAVHVTKPQSWITDNALYVSKNLGGLRLRYLAEALRMANLNQYAGRAAQPLISGGRIYPVEILVPSEAKQITFEKFLLAAEDSYEQIYSSQTQIETAFTSLQHRAFSGQL